MEKTETGKLRLIFAFLILCSYMGCAHQTVKVGDETQLRERIDLAWKAKINMNSKQLYDMTTDAHKKEVPFEAFSKSGNVKINKYEITGLEIQGESATVQIDYEVNQMGFAFKFSAGEKWLWEKGEWRLDAIPVPKPKDGDIMPKVPAKKE